MPHPTSTAHAVATLAAYGPDDQRATKLVVAVFPSPQAREPVEIRTWFAAGGDVRNDPVTAEEVKAFVTSHQVRQAISPPNILGCPHEEGTDYPEGGTCPHCPYWANLRRTTRDGRRPSAPPPVQVEPRVGRNDPCPCGSGRKFKKCCGKAVP